MILRLVLLLVAVSGLKVAAQSTWTTDNWNVAAGVEVRSDSAGALVLGEVDPRTNLALQKTAVDHLGATPKITDGNTTRNSAWNSIREGAFNFFVQVDLEEARLVNRVVIVPVDGDEGGTDFMKGYSIQTSLDNTVFKEQVFNDRNLNKLIDTTLVPAVVGRYVRVQVKAVDNVHKVQIAELEVYGAGFLSAGSFTSAVADLRSAKNFGRLQWEAEVPEGAELTLQVRTGPSSTPGDTWSDWTRPSTAAAGVLIELPEPRRYFQYQVNLRTTDPEVSPRLRRLALDYGDPLAQEVTGAVVREDEGGAEPDTLTPDEAPVGRQSHFRYRVQVTMGAGVGFDVLRLRLPNRAQVEQVQVDGAQLVPGADYTLEGDTTTVDLRFARRLSQDADIQVKLNATLFDELNAFGGEVIDSGQPDNPQEMEPDSPGALEIFGVGLIDKVLEKSRLSVAPNPFSPNGDGRFDAVQFRYELAKLSIPRPVTLRVFDLTGRPIRQLEVAQKSGTHVLEWDGRDEDGKTVPPGLYLFQFDVDSGEGIAFNGVIGVSY